MKTPESCNYVVCGRVNNGFVVGAGCGKAWCWFCARKLCGKMYDHQTGDMLDANEDHNHAPGCDAFAVCNGEGFCPGGHNSHKKRPVAHLQDL